RRVEPGPARNAACGGRIRASPGAFPKAPAQPRSAPRPEPSSTGARAARPLTSRLAGLHSPRGLVAAIERMFSSAALGRTLRSAVRGGQGRAGFRPRPALNLCGVAPPQLDRTGCLEESTLDSSASNPLRAGSHLERTPDPAAIVIFGASGDLTRRKL